MGAEKLVEFPMYSENFPPSPRKECKLLLLKATKSLDMKSFIFSRISGFVIECGN